MRTSVFRVLLGTDLAPETQGSGRNREAVAPQQFLQGYPETGSPQSLDGKCAGSCPTRAPCRLGAGFRLSARSGG
jgi:hypothetical protein